MSRRRISIALALASAGAALVAAPASAQAPTATTGSASGVTSAGATLAGTVTPNGQATTYAFDYGTSSAYGSSTATASAGSGSSAVAAHATLTGLRPGTTYHYRLVASNASGTAAGHDETFTTTSPPAASTGAVSAVGRTSATVSASVDPRGRATKVVFDYGTSTAYGAVTAAQDAGQGTATITVKATLTGLRPGTAYHVRVRASSDAGTTSGADRAFTTAAAQGPTATTGPASAIGPAGATLTGTATPRGTATQAYFEYGTSTRYGASTPRTGVGSGTKAVAVRAAVTGLRPGTTYHFRVVAVNAAGTSARGGDRSFRTSAAPTVSALVASPSPVPYGHRATLRGSVRGAGAPGAAVTLLADPFPFAGATPWAAVRADASGAFRVALGPLRATTRYRARATVAGIAVGSAALRVGVRPAMRYSVRRLAGGRLRFRGTIRPGRPATVWLRRVGPHVTVTVARTRARPAGPLRRSFTLTVRAPRRRSVYRIRVRTDSRALQRFDTAPRAVRGR
jgi:hypothetical protein